MPPTTEVVEIGEDLCLYEVFTPLDGPGRPELHLLEGIHSVLDTPERRPIVSLSVSYSRADDTRPAGIHAFVVLGEPVGKQHREEFNGD